MKKITLFLILMWFCTYAMAQVPPINDTTQVSPNKIVSPVQIRQGLYNSGGTQYRLWYLVDPSTGKLDFVPSGKYLRQYYPLDANVIHTTGNEIKNGNLLLNGQLTLQVSGNVGQFLNGSSFSSPNSNKIELNQTYAPYGSGLVTQIIGGKAIVFTSRSDANLASDVIIKGNQIKRSDSLRVLWQGDVYSKAQVDSASNSAKSKYKDTTFSVGGFNNVTVPSLINANLLSVTRSTTYYPTVSSSPTGNHYYFNAATGNVKFQDNFGANETVGFIYNFGTSSGSGTSTAALSLTRYATFSAVPFPQTVGVIEIINDETRPDDDGIGKHTFYFVPKDGAANSTYLKWIFTTQTNP